MTQQQTSGALARAFGWRVAKIARDRQCGLIEAAQHLAQEFTECSHSESEFVKGHQSPEAVADTVEQQLRTAVSGCKQASLTSVLVELAERSAQERRQ